MYLAYWQLQSRPFESSPDTRFYYPSECHQGALLKLRYAVETQRSSALLVGAAGLGKSLLAASLLRQLPETFNPRVHLVFPQMSRAELLAYLAGELGVVSNSQRTATVDECVRRLQEFFAENHRRNQHATIVIDEAQLLIESGALETLRLLLNFEDTSGSAPSLVIVGQPELLPALSRLPALEARLGVKCLLRPLDADETASYVSHRMKAAGAAREIFSSEALTALHEITGGNPRRINRLCDLALLIGFAEDQVRINAAHIEAVSNELVTIAPEE